LAIGALALMVVLALVIGTVVALRNISNNSTVAATQLRIAATNLSNAPGTHYVGTITNPDGDKTQIDLEVTNNGSTHGTLTQRGDKLEVLAVDHKTFLKASELFWSKHGVAQISVEEYAKQWVKVSGDVIGIDIQKILAPVTLGQQLGQTARSSRITLGPETTINGVQTRKVITPQGTLYITTTPPQRIVRIEGTPARTLGGSPQNTTSILSTLSETKAPNPNGGAYQFNLSNLSDSQVVDLYEQLQQKIQDLRNSVDADVQFRLNGNGVLAPCGDFGCTATLTISNSVIVTNPDLKVDQPVTVSITINFTVDGIPVGGCPSMSRTMPPNGETTVQCSVTYSIPPSNTTTIHEVVATWMAFAQALVTADIPRIVGDLQKQETEIEEQEVLQTKLTEAEQKETNRIAIRNLDDLKKLKDTRPTRENPPPGIKADDPLYQEYMDYLDERIEQFEIAFKNNPNARPQIKGPVPWDAYQRFQRQVREGREFQKKVTRDLIAEDGQDMDIQQDVDISKNGKTWRPDQLVVSKDTLKALPDKPEVATYSNKSRDFKNLSDRNSAKTQIEEDVQELFDKYSGEFKINRSKNQTFDERTGEFRVDGSKYPLAGKTVKANKVTLVYNAKYVPKSIQQTIRNMAQDKADALNGDLPDGQTIEFKVEFR
jgi:hypothetical protein